MKPRTVSKLQCRKVKQLSSLHEAWIWEEGCDWLCAAEYQGGGRWTQKAMEICRETPSNLWLSTDLYIYAVSLWSSGISIGKNNKASNFQSSLTKDGEQFALPPPWVESSHNTQDTGQNSHFCYSRPRKLIQTRAELNQK